MGKRKPPPLNLDIDVWLSLKAGAVRDVFTYLYWKQGRNTDAWPKIATIAKDLGRSYRSVQSAIQTLKASGHVAVTLQREQRRSSRYRVIQHPRPAKEAGEIGSQESAKTAESEPTDSAKTAESDRQKLRTRPAKTAGQPTQKLPVATGKNCVAEPSQLTSPIEPAPIEAAGLQAEQHLELIFERYEAHYGTKPKKSWTSSRSKKRSLAQVRECLEQDASIFEAELDAFLKRTHGKIERSLVGWFERSYGEWVDELEAKGPMGRAPGLASTAVSDFSEADRSVTEAYLRLAEEEER